MIRKDKLASSWQFYRSFEGKPNGFQLSWPIVISITKPNASAHSQKCVEFQIGTSNVTCPSGFLEETEELKLTGGMNEFDFETCIYIFHSLRQYILRNWPITDQKQINFDSKPPPTSFNHCLARFSNDEKWHIHSRSSTQNLNASLMNN